MINQIRGKFTAIVYYKRLLRKKELKISYKQSLKSVINFLF